VTVVGAPNLAAQMPTSASQAYSRNIGALVAHLLTDGELGIDLTDEIQQGVVITHAGAVVHPGTAALLPADAPSLTDAVGDTP
jgi:NAD(P) transhydrogenase subunit alpha